jgi:hypothetical protein
VRPVRWLYLGLFGIGIVVYAIGACGRIGKQSSAPHFVYQADAWLHGKISVAPNCGPCGPNDACDPPPRACRNGEPQLPADDWATVETVVLDDGRTVQGRRLVQPWFRTLGGREFPASEIRQPRVNAKTWRFASLTCGLANSLALCWNTTEPADQVLLHDEREAIGRRFNVFRLLGGSQVPVTSITRSVGYTAYVSFPAVPARLMIPSAAISGRAGNDVIPTLLVAAAILPLALLLLRRLAQAQLSKRSLHDDLWLVALLAFGSVLFFSAVQGKVWFTAHVVGVALALIYAWASIEAKHPIVAGLALGAAALTRTSMAFMLPIFLFEAWRLAKTTGVTDRKQLLRALRTPLVKFAIPVVALAVAGMIYNYVRFDSPTEFGHSYLALGNRQPVRQQVQIEQWGLASYHYLGRNLAVAFTLLPELFARPPWIQISGHGLAMWVTTPALLLLLWPRDKGPFHRVLWLTVLCVALPSLFYMNSGWVQFGYRFSLDYIVFLVMLLAVGGRPLTPIVKGLIIVGIVVNAFGAYSFDRDWDFYRVGGNAYDVIVAQ